MDPRSNLIILLIMIFVGGFFISVTFYGFFVFSRFLDRERLAADRFRAENRPPQKLADEEDLLE